ncbi:hypothetical protein Pyn_10729 [Prunus yedoensis var. nudiflora]|uniref:Uncharacterized protein n=1 Tax=Prunus yedoensis var. nudiflora TaxID=2094558 RepID=A0A314Y1M5_PRUYE|nr:hypothetical protein Pyn_10729 [Prunus yedoensis var. nudiflora]
MQNFWKLANEVGTGAESEGEEAGAVGGEVGFELGGRAGSDPSGLCVLLGINGAKLKKFVASGGAGGGTVASWSTLP